MNMSLDSRNKFLILAVALIVMVLGALLLSRESGQASAEALSDDPPLSVLEPATQEMVEDQPAAVRRQLVFAASGVEARNPEEPATVESLGESEVPGEGTVEVAEVGEEVCAFQTGQIGNCADPEQIAMGRIFTATPVGCEGYEVLGIVDDQVASIRVSPEGGESFELEVHSNIYLGDFPANSTLIEGLDASGNVVFSNRLPLDEYLEQNDGCEASQGTSASS